MKSEGAQPLVTTDHNLCCLVASDSLQHVPLHKEREASANCLS